MLQIIQFSNEEASRIFEAKGDNDLVISYSWSQFTEETNESVPTDYLGVMRKTPVGARLSRNLKYFAALIFTVKDITLKLTTIPYTFRR